MMVCRCCWWVLYVGGNRPLAQFVSGSSYVLYLGTVLSIDTRVDAYSGPLLK